MTLRLAGKSFGRLVAIKCVGSHKSKRVWHCECACGNTHLVTASLLTEGKVRSCGCLVKEGSEGQRASATKHGHSAHGSATRTYSTWTAMVDRCRNENAPNYELYGGRGISVCPQWSDFTTFLEDMGERPLNTSIDRINSNGNYEPKNCRWASTSQQNRNKRNNKLSPADIKSIRLDSRSQASIAKHFGVSQPLISRIKSRQIWA